MSDQKPTWSVEGGRILTRNGVSVAVLLRVDNWQTGAPALTLAENDALALHIAQLLTTHGDKP